jgi:hypothetical protein
MKKKWFIGIAVVVLSLSMLGSAFAAGNGQSELAQVRNATAKYQNESVAIADGYIPLAAEYNAVIPGVGIMGLHYINFELLADPAIDPDKPEVLLYVPSKDSKDGVRLVGVEYVVAAAQWTGEKPPSIFGQTFEGPLHGHAPGEPDHYDKHVWLWQANPKGFNEAEWPKSPGIFSQWNATVNQK